MATFDFFVCMTAIFLPLSQSTLIITPASTRACLNERMTVYCVADNVLEWRSEQVIGSNGIPLRVGLQLPGSIVSRRNATAVFVSLNGNTINSSLSFFANNGVSIVCIEDGSTNDTYIQLISQRAQRVDLSLESENSQYNLAWNEPTNSNEYDFLNYMVTIRNIDKSTSTVRTTTSTSIDDLNLERGTNYLLTVTTVSRCDQNDVASLNVSLAVTPSPLSLPSGQAALALGIILLLLILLLLAVGISFGVYAFKIKV